MPCVAANVNCEFPDEWKNIIFADDKEIYEMFPLNNAKARDRQLSEKNKKIRLMCLPIKFRRHLRLVARTGGIGSWGFSSLIDWTQMECIIGVKISNLRQARASRRFHALRVVRFSELWGGMPPFAHK